MTEQELRAEIDRRLAAHKGDMDGLEYAWYEGAWEVLKHIGDGGISETFIEGMKWAIDNLSDEAIGGQYDEDIVEYD